MRLHALLEQSRERAITWVAGPPGAGKTTLVAGFVGGNVSLGLWYQLDRDDGDPASFFHYLRQSAADVAERRPALPALTPEYLTDLEGFSRRFFRAFYAQRIPASVFVLDNYQEVESDSGFHAVLAVAVDELPPGMNVFVISRAEPPPRFARHIAAGRMACIGWEDLRLTPDETSEIARCNGIAEMAVVRLVHEHSAGWAAGLRLLLEAFKRAGALHIDGSMLPLDSVFDYFADQVFLHIPQPVQRFLLSTSVLPRMTADLASDISGEKEAGRLLEALHRRHMFTDRRLGGQVTYQYHGMFRAFLQARAIGVFRHRRWASLNRRAAALLESAGAIEDAIEVCLVSGQWSSAARLITQSARRLLAQGRGQTLRQWIGTLPDEQPEHAAALKYWLGASLIPVDQERARTLLEEAYASYASASDLTGQLLASAGIIEARFLQHANHRLVDSWLPVHERLLMQVRPDTPQEAQLSAFATMLITLLYRQPENPMLEVCAQRVLLLVDSLEVAADRRITAATFLVWYCSYVGDFRTMRRVLPIGDALLDATELSVLHRANWRIWLGYCQHCMLDDAAAQQSLEPALQLGEESGLRPVIFLASYFLGLVHARLGKYEAATACIERMEDVADPQLRIQRAIVHAMRGWLAVERAEPVTALRHGALAWEIGAELGSPSYLLHWGMPKVYGLVESGRLEEARQHVQMQREVIAPTRIRCFEPALLAAEAIIALREGKTDIARKCAADAFRVAQERDHAGYLRRLSPWIGECAALALDAGNDGDDVRAILLRSHAEPPSQTACKWPWRWRLVTLGRFEISIAGEVVGFGRKVPRKPLALLATLVAAGPGGAAEDDLCNELWPDLEGDAGHRALAIAIHRLRTMLGESSTVQVAGNRVCLNDRQVWVDAWAFEALADEAGSDETTRVASALQLYAGSFLPAQRDSGRTLSVRERLRSKFIRLTTHLAQSEEAMGHWERAAAMYRRGIEADDLSEPFYRGLMRCHARLGRINEAVVAYRNLRHLLSVTLGRKPSRDTESLYRSLVAQP